MREEVEKHNAKPRFFLRERTIFQRSDAKLNDDGSMSVMLNFPVAEIHEAVKDPQKVLEIMLRCVQ